VIWVVVSFSLRLAVFASLDTTGWMIVRLMVGSRPGQAAVLDM